MDEDIQFFPTKDYLETKNYSLDIFKCGIGKMIVAIDKVSRSNICEPFEDGKGLRETYYEVKNSNLQGKEIDNLLDHYFETHFDSQSEVKSETGSLIEIFL